VAVFESQEMNGILAGAINRLGEREKIVITLYYEGLTLAEVGQVLGATESRVRQLHTKAVPTRQPLTAVPPAGSRLEVAIHILVGDGPPALAAR
jgi:DNA-directed RNA polymerase sigma subunit (sigma70/sigma32)